MKSKYLALAIFAATFAAPAFASEHEGWVYNGLTGIGRADLDVGSGNNLSDDSFSSNSNIGYRWGVFGVEVGYSMFGKFKHDEAGVAEIKLKADGWNLGVNVNHDLSDKWSIQGRAGVFGWNDDLDIDYVAPLLLDVSASDSGTDFYAGASIDYTWRKRSSVGVGYTYYKAGDADIGLWGLHSEFRF